METENLMISIEAYKKQLSDVELAISTTEEDTEKQELIGLRTSLRELIELIEGSLTCAVAQKKPSQGETATDPLTDEFALFMAEMEKDGATKNPNASLADSDLQKELKSLEGMKCRAPHEHQWGDVMYHNAMVCSVLPWNGQQAFEEIEVKVLFINPTHEEMLPCPYLMETSCKFDDDKCKYSHGEIVLFSSLQEYIEPKYDLIEAGCKILAKQRNKLWGRGTVRRMFGERCLVKFDADDKDLELELHDVLPLNSIGNSSDEDGNSDDSSDREDTINLSLLNVPTNQALGEWEKHTKGIGSKIMQKMGYVVGTGLGRSCDGRIEPVPAVALPPGKSLDHCMNLREKAGGDKDLFSVEKKLRRLQKKQEKQNMRAYEREQKKVNVFSFLNKTLSNRKEEHNANVLKSKHRQEIKQETSRSLNVASLKIDEDIKRIEKELQKIRQSLSRHSDVRSQVHKSLKQKLVAKQRDLQALQTKASNISHEQRNRTDKKKLTVF